MGATMFSVFGALALVVSAIGLYSLLAFDVACRTRELGMRSALGASGGRLVRMVLGQSLGVAAAGIALGGVAALLLSPRLEPLLFETSPREPSTFLAVALALVVVAAGASGFPAWRASRVDPSRALGSE
jgi:ABC-type antimicrobial peptide transport system permease subunit